MYGFSAHFINFSEQSITNKSLTESLDFLRCLQRAFISISHLNRLIVVERGSWLKCSWLVCFLRFAVLGWRGLCSGWGDCSEVLLLWRSPALWRHPGSAGYVLFCPTSASIHYTSGPKLWWFVHSKTSKQNGMDWNRIINLTYSFDVKA